MADERAGFEHFRRWRQAAVWAPVLWFSLAITGFALGWSGLAIVLILSGLVFTGMCCAVVWFGRCPSCNARFGESTRAFRRFWDDATCDACALSLFELRRRGSTSR